MKIKSDDLMTRLAREFVQREARACIHFGAMSDDPIDKEIGRMGQRLLDWLYPQPSTAELARASGLSY